MKIQGGETPKFTQIRRLSETLTLYYFWRDWSPYAFSQLVKEEAMSSDVTVRRWKILKRSHGYPLPRLQVGRTLGGALSRDRTRIHAHELCNGHMRDAYRYTKIEVHV